MLGSPVTSATARMQFSCPAEPDISRQMLASFLPTAMEWRQFVLSISSPTPSQSAGSDPLAAALMQEDLKDGLDIESQIFGSPRAFATWLRHWSRVSSFFISAQ